MILFVYGSLKKGFFNHKRFGFDKFPFIGEMTLEGYEMYDLGHYPGIVNADNPKADSVKGELYDLPDDSEEYLFLDRVETGAMFRLASIKILSKAEFPKLPKNLPAYAYIYVGGDFGPKVKGGDWRE